MLVPLPWLRAAALLVVLLAAGHAAPARASDTAGWMFHPSVVVQIRLTLSDDSLAALASDPYTYVPATFAMSHREKQYGPFAVTLKLKGRLGSFRGMNGKAAFKVKFPAGARPDGLKKMTLNNMVQDASKVHEAVGYELFRAMGVAAPRTGYAEVLVNDVPFGLYLNLETLDGVALARWYAETQHLYEGSYGYLSDPTNPFGAHYEVDEGDGDDRTDLAALLATAADASDGWYARMAALADLDQMTRMWATEAYVGHWDGYSGRITGNYYLHADGAGRFTMLPWGTDQTFGERVGFYENAGPHVLFAGCVADPICGSLYADALMAVAATAKRLRLDGRAGRIHRGIRSRIDADPRLEHSADASRTACNAMIAFARRRRTDVAAWAALLPPGPRSPAIRGGAGSLTVRWATPGGRSGTAITGYAVDYRPPGSPWIRALAAPSTTTLTVTDLSFATYEVRVRALAGSVASASAKRKEATVTAP